MLTLKLRAAPTGGTPATASFGGIAPSRASTRRRRSRATLSLHLHQTVFYEASDYDALQIADDNLLMGNDRLLAIPFDALQVGGVELCIGTVRLAAIPEP